MPGGLQPQPNEIPALDDFSWVDNSTTRTGGSFDETGFGTTGVDLNFPFDGSTGDAYAYQTLALTIGVSYSWFGFFKATGMGDQQIGFTCLDSSFGGAGNGHAAFTVLDDGNWHVIGFTFTANSQDVASGNVAVGFENGVFPSFPAGDVICAGLQFGPTPTVFSGPPSPNLLPNLGQPTIDLTTGPAVGDSTKWSGFAFPGITTGQADPLSGTAAILIDFHSESTGQNAFIYANPSSSPISGNSYTWYCQIKAFPGGGAIRVGFGTSQNPGFDSGTYVPAAGNVWFDVPDDSAWHTINFDFVADGSGGDVGHSFVGNSDGPSSANDPTVAPHKYYIFSPQFGPTSTGSGAALAADNDCDSEVTGALSTSIKCAATPAAVCTRRRLSRRPPISRRPLPASRLSSARPFR